MEKYQNLGEKSVSWKSTIASSVSEFSYAKASCPPPSDGYYAKAKKAYPGTDGDEFLIEDVPPAGTDGDEFLIEDVPPAVAVKGIVLFYVAFNDDKVKFVTEVIPWYMEQYGALFTRIRNAGYEISIMPSDRTATEILSLV